MCLGPATGMVTDVITLAVNILLVAGITSLLNQECKENVACCQKSGGSAVGAFRLSGLSSMLNTCVLLISIFIGRRRRRPPAAVHWPWLDSLGELLGYMSEVGT